MSRPVLCNSRNQIAKGILLHRITVTACLLVIASVLITPTAWAQTTSPTGATVVTARPPVTGSLPDIPCSEQLRQLAEAKKNLSANVLSQPPTVGANALFYGSTAPCSLSQPPPSLPLVPAPVAACRSEALAENATLTDYTASHADAVAASTKITSLVKMQYLPLKDKWQSYQASLYLLGLDVPKCEDIRKQIASTMTAAKAIIDKIQ